MHDEDQLDLEIQEIPDLWKIGAYHPPATEVEDDSVVETFVFNEIWTFDHLMELVVDSECQYYRFFPRNIVFFTYSSEERNAPYPRKWSVTPRTMITAEPYQALPAGRRRLLFLMLRVEMERRGISMRSYNNDMD